MYESTKTNRNIKGITLLEMLLVIGILVIIGMMGSGIYRNYSKNVELDSVANSIIFDLRSVRSKAINGKDGLKWGIHFINDTSDYYEIFSTPTDYSDPAKEVKRSTYLSGRISLSDPIESTNKDIIFNKIIGSVDVQGKIDVEFENNIETITITILGNIY